jgi:hypothetical protein
MNSALVIGILKCMGSGAGDNGNNKVISDQEKELEVCIKKTRQDKSQSCSKLSVTVL